MTAISEFRDQVLTALRPAILAMGSLARSLNGSMERFALALTPRNQRIDELHRRGRHLSAMRTAYRAKTKHRRRNR